MSRTVSVRWHHINFTFCSSSKNVLYPPQNLGCNERAVNSCEWRLHPNIWADQILNTARNYRGNWYSRLRWRLQPRYLSDIWEGVMNHEASNHPHKFSMTWLIFEQFLRGRVSVQAALYGREMYWSLIDFNSNLLLSPAPWEVWWVWLQWWIEVRGIVACGGLTLDPETFHAFQHL